MLPLRKILFYLFCLVYCLLTPLIIARMLGFIFNPLTHHFIKTGLIFVSTNPSEATVFVDGRMGRHTTPTIIRDLPPGEHFVRIQLAGYQDWKANVPIAAKKATVLENTLLIPETWPIQKISNKPYQDLLQAAPGILIGVNHHIKDIDIINTEDDPAHAVRSLLPSLSPYADGQLIKIFPVIERPFLIVQISMQNKNTFLRINLNDRHVSVLNPKAILPSILAKSTNLKMPPSFPINQRDILAKEGPFVRLYPKNALQNAPGIIIDSVTPSSHIYFEPKNGKLFYLHGNSKFLYAALIIQPQPLLNLAIPEKLKLQSL